MTRWKRGALIAVSILAISYPVAWLGVQHTDAYAAAESFIRTDPQVVASAGVVRHVGLPFFGSYSFEVSGGTGDATFEMNVETDRSQMRAFVDLRKRGTWEVTDVRLVSAANVVTRLVPPSPKNL